METSFLLDRKVISLCFNPIKESIFILSNDGEKLQLIEEDLSKSVILKEFKLLQLSECNITNPNYRKISKESYEGYYIYFWELEKKLIVVFPGGYLLIYDYSTMQLINHFQCQGKKAYVIRNIIGSPLNKSLFISAQNMRNIYHMNFDNLKKEMIYNKLVIPEKEAVFDLICHPNEKFVFAACSDGLIRIFNYTQENSISEIKIGLVDIPLDKKSKPPKNQTALIKKEGLLNVISMDMNNTGTYLLSGNENGYMYLWDSMQAIKGKRILLTKQRFSSGSIYAIKFIKCRQYENMNRFICVTKEGKFHILNVTVKNTGKIIKKLKN
jgi:WD40 repeat protein